MNQGGPEPGLPERESRSPRPKLPRSATVTAFVVLALLVLVAILLRFGFSRRPRVSGPEVPHPESSFYSGDRMQQHELLADMLVRLSVPEELVGACQAALAKTDFDFRRLRPGDSVTVAYKGLALVGLTYHKDLATCYEVRFDSAGAVAARFDRPVDTVRTVVGGTVKQSLWSSLLALGEQPWLAVNFAEILRYDVDFFTESNEGDSFQIVVDKLQVDTAFFRYGRIHVVHYKGRTDNTYGFFFLDPSGHWDYYNEHGQSLRKTVLRSPLQFARVTSYFGNRFHPIYRVWRPHHGVDYGAPTGTPVSCIADGTVTIAGRRGGYGRLVEVKHQGGLSSRYGHLSGFGPGVRTGRRLHQGQTIGYVGRTGDATGPHLHFEIRKGGKPVNPLKVIPPRAEPVKKKYMPDFEAVKQRCLAEIAGRSSMENWE